MGMGITALQVVYRTSPPSKVELALSLDRASRDVLHQKVALLQFSCVARRVAVGCTELRHILEEPVVLLH
jgi:hypothetical protein